LTLVSVNIEQKLKSLFNCNKMYRLRPVFINLSPPSIPPPSLKKYHFLSKKKTLDYQGQVSIASLSQIKNWPFFNCTDRFLKILICANVSSLYVNNNVKMFFSIVFKTS
jgi:hypothetical protein